jgi:hypothetical protein
VSPERFRGAATAAVVAVAVALSSGCVVTDGGYGYGGAPYGVGYYEPAGIAYGGWGPGYDVAPFRRGYPLRYGGHPPPHAYRAAPASRAMPSIPTGARPGGGHGGGGHGGGGGGHR